MTYCYDCKRKHECYTPEQVARITPETPFCGGVCDCGALFTDYDGARTLLLRIGDALNAIPKKHRDAVIRHVAESYGSSTYFVLTELYE